MDISITQKRERRFLRQYANFGLFSSPPFVVTGVPAAREMSTKEMSLHFYGEFRWSPPTFIQCKQYFMFALYPLIVLLLCTLPVIFPKHMHSNHNFFNSDTFLLGL